MSSHRKKSKRRKTKAGGIIHTYQRYDPVRFPGPTQPAPDLISGAFDHMLMYGNRRELTSEELAGAADGPNHGTAEAWEGVLVGVRDVRLTVINPNADDGDLCADGDEDCKDYGNIGVTGGLRVTARLLPDLTAGVHFERRIGVEFSSLVGVAEEAFGHHGLAPRTLADVTVQN